jgi:hypothetical protein
MLLVSRAEIVIVALKNLLKHFDFILYEFLSEF